MGLLGLLAACAPPLAGGRINLDPARVSGLPRCASDVEAASHGIVFLLQGTSESCGRPGGIPSIGLFVNPNDAVFIPRLESLIEADCAPADGTVRAVLHTRAERLVADMVVFRRIIAAVRLVRTAGPAQP